MKKSNLKLAVGLRHQLHRYPELSNFEFETKKRIINFLKKNTRLKIVDKGNWFYAVYEYSKSSKNIGFRADIDAVAIDENIKIPYKSVKKGVSHKCGHDGHAATLAGFALEVDQNKPDKNIYFIFQHGEEIGEGALECSEIINEKSIAEVFAYHNMSGMVLKSINIISGVAHFASKGIIIKMYGRPSHASEPEKGINPSYAAANIINLIPKIAEEEQDKGLLLATVVQIDIGKEAFGVSPGEGKILLTVRAEYEEELNRFQKKIEKAAKDEAEKWSVKLDISYNDCFPETINHSESVEKIKEVGLKKNYKIKELKKPFRASEDFGYYTKNTKGAIFYIGNGENYPDIHTEDYDFNDEVIETAVEMFKGLCEF